ncbi:MAG: hypothetical protein NVSMB18_06670 [Acetobacteraceae bacterium]
MSTETDVSDSVLTDRQERERIFHVEYARKQAGRASTPVQLDVIDPGPRRWWNAFWSMYDDLLAVDLVGKKVLVPGCGFGEDVLRLSAMGADAYGFDLSPEVIAITRQRAEAFARTPVTVHVMAAETMNYPDDFFDVVVLVDVLHHVDIPRTMAEIRRVLKPGGLVIGDELYTHSRLQRVREGRLVSRFLYPRMVKFIYGQATPYITADEHKIDEHEFATVLASMSDTTTRFFGMLEGRLFPNRMSWASKLDQRFLRAVGPFSAFLGSRVVFRGTIRKAA